MLAAVLEDMENVDQLRMIHNRYLCNVNVFAVRKAGGAKIKIISPASARLTTIAEFAHRSFIL